MMKKFLKYFVFSILCIEIINLFSFYQANAEDNDRYVYQNGDLRCPPNSSDSECKLINDGNEVVVMHTENDVTITKHVQKTETVGRYKVWFEIQNKGDTTTQVVESNTYVYLIADASSTNENNLDDIKPALKSFYNILAKKNIYFTGGAFDNTAINFSENFVTDINNLKFKLDPSESSTSYLYRSLNKAVSMFNKTDIKPEDKKIVVVLGDGLYYRCTDYKSSGDCKGNNKSRVQSESLNEIDKSLTNLRNQGVELYFIKYYGGSGSKGYTWYQNLYDLPDEYFDKSKFLSKANPCEKNAGCKIYNYYHIMYNATSGEAVTQELVKYIIRAGNNIKIGDNGEMAKVSNYYVVKSDDFTTTLNYLANRITNNIHTVNISYDYELIDNIYDAFINENTGFQGGRHEYRLSGSDTITTEPFYIKIAENLKNIDNDDDWYNTNNNFYLKFKKDEKNVNISCDVNPQVYWIEKKLTIDSCFGTAQYNEAYDLSSKYYKIECSEGYDNKNGFVAHFNVGGLDKKTNSFKTRGFGFPVSIELSTNVSCTYKFDVDSFKTDYNKLNICLLNNSENTPEYSSCYKKKIEMDEITNNYINMAGNNNDNKGKNLEEYISDFENINGNLVVNYIDNITDELNFITSDFNKMIQCTNGSSLKLVNNQVVNTDYSCYLSLSKKLQLDNSCIDMKTANKTNCSNSTLDGGNLYYMNLDKKKASILINIYSTGYMGNVGLGLKNCNVFQDIDFNITYRPIDLNDPFLQSYDTNREIGRNFSNSNYNFVNIIKSDIWKQNFMYRYSLSKANVEKIRKDTSEEGANSYLGRNCYFTSDNKYICDFTRNNASTDAITNQTGWFTKSEINN